MFNVSPLAGLRGYATMALWGANSCLSSIGQTSLMPLASWMALQSASVGLQPKTWNPTWLSIVLRVADATIRAITVYQY